MIRTDAKCYMQIKRRIVRGEKTFSKKKELPRGKLDRNQKKRTIKANAMRCCAVGLWIIDLGYEKRRYKKIGGLRNVHMNRGLRRRMEKISRTKHRPNNKLRSALNDWRRKIPDTDTKKETKEYGE